MNDFCRSQGKLGNYAALVFLDFVGLISIDIFVSRNVEPKFLLGEILRSDTINATAAFELAGRVKRQKIPKIVHFAILKEKEPYDLYLFQYLAIKAAKVNGKAEEIYLHCYFPPEGKWFNKSMKYITKVIEVGNLPNEIFGIKVDRLAHRKDVYELKTLGKYGGIFLDMDAVVLRDLEDLLIYDFVMPIEGTSALAIAFVLSTSSSYFLEKFTNIYKNFTNNQWAVLCCIEPFKLSKKYPEHIHILPQQAFSEPRWTYEGIRKAYFDRTYNYSENYATHLSETLANIFIRPLTVNKIWSLDTSLFCELRKLTVDEEGAGTFTEEISKDCQVVEKGGVISRVNGLIGRWDLRNISALAALKIPDSSGNRMHGLLSPMLGYELAHKKAFDDPNFMVFNGDHVYLPMLPEVTSRSFTLTFWIRFPDAPQKPKATIAVIELGNSATLRLEPQTKTAVILTLTSKNISLSGNISDVYSNRWYLLSVGCDSKGCTLRNNAACLAPNGTALTNSTKSDLTEKFLPYPLEGMNHLPLKAIWLGRVKSEVKGWYWNVQHDTDTFCDMSDVRLYDTTLNARQVLTLTKETFRCIGDF